MQKTRRIKKNINLGSAFCWLTLHNCITMHGTKKNMNINYYSPLIEFQQNVTKVDGLHELVHLWHNTELFISPSGISELDCATTKTDTAERSISIGRESLQVFETNRPSGPMGPDGLFVSQRTGSHSAGIHVPFTNCFVCMWFCVVHDPKPPLHSHN